MAFYDAHKITCSLALINNGRLNVIVDCVVGDRHSWFHDEHRHGHERWEFWSFVRVLVFLLSIYVEMITGGHMTGWPKPVHF